MIQGAIEIVIQTVFEGGYYLLERRYGQGIALGVMFGVPALIVAAIALLIWWNP
jgi:hypothetical protein